MGLHSISPEKPLISKEDYFVAERVSKIFSHDNIGADTRIYPLGVKHQRIQYRYNDGNWKWLNEEDYDYCTVPNARSYPDIVIPTPEIIYE